VYDDVIKTRTAIIRLNRDFSRGMMTRDQYELDLLILLSELYIEANK